ncbi:MAG TPA: hypothetical protein VK163_01275 [Opitutaceae bacterium]|nr:hypothetical protein [Opitutaceae bacterium]
MSTLRARLAWWAIYAALWFVAVFGSGCAFGHARVKTATASAMAPADPATPARVESAGIEIPAGSPVEIRRETVQDAPASPGDPLPAPREVVTISTTPAAPLVIRAESATSGTQRAPDARAELRRADNAARAPLLYVAIACALGAVAAGFLRYPTATIAAGIAAGLFFFAWQSAGLPAWLVVLAWVLIGGAAALIVGHEIGERRKKQEAASAAPA